MGISARHRRTNMKILKLILASIVFSFMLSGCSMCFDKKIDYVYILSKM